MTEHRFMTRMRERGSILISLIVGITAAAALGAGMLYLTTTTTLGELFANRQARAYYLAEAGGRYAQILLADNTGDEAFYPGGYYPDSTTYELDGGDRFTLSGREYVDNGEPQAGWVVVESVGIVHAGTWMETKRRITYVINRNKPFPGGGGDDPFIEFMIEESVFVYGTEFGFAGSNVVGPGATMVVKGDLVTDDMNRGASVGASTIWIDGSVDLHGGSASLGSEEEPGAIYVDGDMRLWNGRRDIYGDVYIQGDFFLKDARIHGNVYVDGDVTLGWTPWLSSDSRVYYTGTLTHPSSMSSDITSKFIHQPSVPGFTMPDFPIPPPQTADWFDERDYQPGGTLVSELKVYTTGDYVSSSWRPTAENVIIVSEGDISITRLGDSGLTGFLYAPHGKVTFGGSFFEGIIIARDGVDVITGGTTVTFRDIDHYIPNPEDYPFLFESEPNIIQY